MSTKTFHNLPAVPHPDTTTKAGGPANRNAGFIRQPQCGPPACRMNPAFRWWWQDAPFRLWPQPNIGSEPTPGILCEADFSSNPKNWDPTVDIMIRPLWPYNKSAGIYKCPADRFTVTVNGQTYARVRSISMNFFLGGFAGGSAASGVGVRGWGSLYPIYFKLSDLNSLGTSPGPSKTFVFLDEREDCINWGNFMTDMSGFPCKLYANGNGGLYEWNEDLPASYHNRACGFSFADGHSEIRRWKDPKTMPPVASGVLS